MRDHGTFDLRLEDNILFIDARGPWNKEALLLFANNANALKKQRTSEKWAVLINITGDPIHTPDAAEWLVKQIKSDKKEGRVATAFILTDSSYPELGKRHIHDVYHKAGEQYQFFNNNLDAKRWLSALLVPELIKLKG